MKYVTVCLQIIQRVHLHYEKYFFCETHETFSTLRFQKHGLCVCILMFNACHNRRKFQISNKIITKCSHRRNSNAVMLIFCKRTIIHWKKRGIQTHMYIIQVVAKIVVPNYFMLKIV